ncbi:MAG: hypothetical protein Q9227_007420 [Pyrenula ochraceoflavens]
MPKLRLSAGGVLEFFQSILAALENMLCYPTAVRDGLFKPKSARQSVRQICRPLEDVAQEIRRAFSLPLNTQKMAVMSAEMQARYKEKLQSCPDCMLPSFNYALPTGEEQGTYLALDVGGSTFRVALVELHGRSRGVEGMRIVRMKSAAIDNSVRGLPGLQFFDWMAARIGETVAEGSQYTSTEKPIPVGVSWSFPIEQTSSRRGKVRSMGKGFQCSKHTVGEDLGNLIEAACLRQKLSVCVDAIINDSSATLLSRAYTEPSTTVSLILGTGTNAAMYMPTAYFGASKFGIRSASWHAKAQKVITNTELSMFGRGVLPMTRWDEQLNREHALPDFQPLEYMITGRYLGEIVRLVMLEAVETADLFRGRMPTSLLQQYSLDTAFLAILESDDTPLLSSAEAYLEKHHSLIHRPTLSELSFLKCVAECVSRRAAAYLAIAIHALWSLEKDAEESKVVEATAAKMTIACDGSVINKYPGFRDLCHQFLADLIDLTPAGSGSTRETIVLEPVQEATILGAAVAVAVCEAEIEDEIDGKEAHIQVAPA